MNHYSYITEIQGTSAETQGNAIIDQLNNSKVNSSSEDHTHLIAALAAIIAGELNN